MRFIALLAGIAGAGIASTVATVPALAQTAPVRIIVPYVAGGPTDR